MLQRVPTYGLYGENASETAEFWGHSETIESRSRVHDWEIKAHRHEALFQILHIRSGGVEALISGEWREVPSPCMIVVPQGHEHGFRFSQDIDGAVMTMMATRVLPALSLRGGVADWLKQPRAFTLSQFPADAGYLGETLDRMETELTHATGARAPMVETLLATALMLMFRASGGAGPAADAADRNRERLQQLMQLIDQHHRDHLPVEFYARRIGMSATHLNRLARTLAGRSVGRLLADRLISEAKRDLVFTTHAVQQIAARLGFEDAAYFTRFFTQHAGASPRAFREQQRVETSQ